MGFFKNPLKKHKALKKAVGKTVIGKVGANTAGGKLLGLGQRSGGKPAPTPQPAGRPKPAMAGPSAPVSRPNPRMSGPAPADASGPIGSPRPLPQSGPMLAEGGKVKRKAPPMKRGCK